MKKGHVYKDNSLTKLWELLCNKLSLNQYDKALIEKTYYLIIFEGMKRLLFTQIDFSLSGLRFPKSASSTQGLSVKERFKRAHRKACPLIIYSDFTISTSSLPQRQKVAEIQFNPSLLKERDIKFVLSAHADKIEEAILHWEATSHCARHELTGGSNFECTDPRVYLIDVTTIRDEIANDALHEIEEETRKFRPSIEEWDDYQSFYSHLPEKYRSLLERPVAVVDEYSDW
ncbi:hypothetical protein ACVTNV_000621 [Vibrio alginolyticus]